MSSPYLVTKISYGGGGVTSNHRQGGDLFPLNMSNHYVYSQYSRKTTSCHSFCDLLSFVYRIPLLPSSWSPFSFSLWAILLVFHDLCSFSFSYLFQLLLSMSFSHSRSLSPSPLIYYSPSQSFYLAFSRLYTPPLNLSPLSHSFFSPSPSPLSPNFARPSGFPSFLRLYIFS
jgi:hypothetical protein